MQAAHVIHNRALLRSIACQLDQDQLCFFKGRKITMRNQPAMWSTVKERSKST